MPPSHQFSQLAPAQGLVLSSPQPGPAVVATPGEPIAAAYLKLPPAASIVSHGGTQRLRPAGLILPWSGEAGSHASFSLAPLVAAAWAQSGYSSPIATHAPMGEIAFFWPRIQGKVELPALVAGFGAAAFAKVETTAMPPMRVRLDVPSLAAHKPQLAMPAAETIVKPEQPAFAPLPPAPRKPGLLDALLTPPRSAMSTRPRVRPRDREEIFAYNEPAPVAKSSSADAWRAMFGGLTPSAGAASGVFAVLFLFSALAIFYSAPSGLSQRSPSWRWDSVRAAIRGRAVMRVEDDFRSGLNAWFGPAGWSKDWSYDTSGFLRPGKLGFLQQSMALSDYRLELMGQIERKSLGWAFRAQDPKNYYVAKLTVARPGPLPMVDLVHYAVTNGREGPKARVSLPFSVRNDTLYQVEMNIRGDQFRASVNGHVVDAWTDKRLRAGGVGFVSGQGEASRVRWVRVSDKDDVLGRVCSYLSARAIQPSGELSASYYTILTVPGRPAFF